MKERNQNNNKNNFYYSSQRNKITYFIFHVFALSLLFNNVATFHYYVNTDVIGEYQPGDSIPVITNSLTSIRTQFPLSFYSIPVCRPNKIDSFSLNLGDKFLGYSIQKTSYSIEVFSSSPCQVLCQRNFSTTELNSLRDLVMDSYKVNWSVDNLPVVEKINYNIGDDKVEVQTAGYNLGFIDNEDVYLNNHVSFKISYIDSNNEDDDKNNSIQIYSVEVQPKSIDHDEFDVNNTNSFPITCIQTAPAPPPFSLSGNTTKTVTFTYSVRWEKLESTVDITTRWDEISFQSVGNNVHFFSITNSLLAILILTGIISITLLRTFNANLIKVRRVEIIDDDLDDKKWKLLHGDVFRSPKLPFLFSSLIGFGVQLFLTLAITLIFASIGFLSPISRGSFLTVFIVLFFVMGVCGGYCAGRMSVVFNDEKWFISALISGLVYPLFIFILLIGLNVVNIANDSTASIDFGTNILLFSLWLFVHLPLTIWGNFIGFSNKNVKERKVNETIRRIPSQNWYQTPIITILLGGFLPFGGIFVELFLMISAVWEHQYFFANFILFLNFVLFLILSGEVTVIMCYQHLCGEDYRWWWRSFCTSGISGLYFFIYSIYLLIFRFTIANIWSLVIYLGYTTLMSLIIFIISGTFGFLTTFLFVDKIFSVIKVD